MVIEEMMQTAGQYRYAAQKKSNAHYKMSESATKRHTRIGVPAAVVSAIVGTAIFSTIGSEKANIYAQIFAGLLSILATILVSLQTFFNFSEVASKHRDAAASYEAVRHKLDWFILSNRSAKDGDDLEKPLAALLEIANNMDEIRRTAPNIPDGVYDAAQTTVPTGSSAQGSTANGS